jgi:Vitamin K-dependent gamma-carboxylase
MIRLTNNKGPMDMETETEEPNGERMVGNGIDASFPQPPVLLSKSSHPPKWMAFLVGDTDALPLRMFEVLFTSSFLLWMGRCFVTWEEWLTAKGFHLTGAELTAMGYPEPFPLLPNGWAVAGLAALIAVSGVALIMNRWRRLALWVLFASALYVQGADFVAAFTLNKLFVAVYGILLVSPGYSRDEASGRLTVSAVAVRVIQATLILQYLAAGVAKAFRGDWLKYSDVLYTQVQGVYRTDFAAWMLRTLPVSAWTVMQWTSLLFELEAPVLFCVRKLRTIAFGIGMGFHLMIALVMKDLIFFSLQMWSFYALFITGDEWRRMGGWLARFKPTAPVHPMTTEPIN